MLDPHDWTTDPRPLAECLKEFNRAVNGGRTGGSRVAGQKALGATPSTYTGWLAGRIATNETIIRLAMVEAERRHRRRR